MKKHNKLITLSVIAIVLSSIAIMSQIFVFATHHRNEDEKYAEILKEHFHNFAAPVPKEVTFCGEKVPLENTFVYEALDRELSYITYQHASTFIILKRAFRYFPQIEKVLKSQNVPEDLKYLAVAESSLNNAVSPAKAEGFWQFMPQTAKEYGLVVNAEYDERYDVEKSAMAACKYLKGSYSRLGNWPLACAAYNCGEGGIKARIKEQNVRNYWDLALNNETARYVYRIIAYKIIMQNPQAYGFYIRNIDCHQPLEYDTITVDTTINDFYAFSKQIGTEYKYFRLANPQLQAKKLTNKEGRRYTLKVLNKNSYNRKYLTDKLEDPYGFAEGF
ncbi:MAG: lytic transglycosylase domain-containing protein [Bacteroidales bacterium]|nr:lytic transglycosylase domain-containing protein [Bacteroidales bacterium]